MTATPDPGTPQAPRNSTPPTSSSSGRRIPFDDELREPLRRREPEALASFFDAFFDPVYGYVLRLVGDPALAEDLTQDVFVHIQQKVESYDAARDLQPWVFAIATNLVRSHWRYAGVRERKTVEDLHGDEAAHEVVSAQPSPIELVGDQEARERVARAVLALSEEAREIVVLRAYEELAFDAIADVLEISEVAARKRYSRALGRLRAELGAELEEGGAS